MRRNVWTRAGELLTKGCFGVHSKCCQRFQPIEPPTKPTARNPLPDLDCILDSTPFLENLKICLSKSLNRPVSIYNQQRYLVSLSVGTSYDGMYWSWWCVSVGYEIHSKMGRHWNIGRHPSDGLPALQWQIVWWSADPLELDDVVCGISRLCCLANSTVDVPGAVDFNQFVGHRQVSIR